MNSDLERFLNAERKRVVEPTPDFAARVVARAAALPTRAAQGVWDVVPLAARPVFALALTLLVVFVAIQTFVPVVPREGFVSAYLEGERSDGSLVVETDLLVSDEALGEWIVSEGGL